MPIDKSDKPRVLPDLQAEAAAAARAAKALHVAPKVMQKRERVPALDLMANPDLPAFGEVAIPDGNGATVQCDGSMVYIGLPLKPADQRTVNENNNMTYGGARSRVFALPGRPDLGLWLTTASFTSFRNVKQPTKGTATTVAGTGNPTADLIATLMARGISPERAAQMAGEVAKAESK